MRHKIIVMIIIVIFVLMLPGILTIVFNDKGGDNKISTSYIKVKVYDKQEKKVKELDFEDYIKGVVAAEMPVNFEIEALKAQAIAARTYSYKRIMENQEMIFNQEGYIGEAYLSDKQLEKRWGEKNVNKYMSKILEAVNSTNDIIMTYYNEPVEAVFHSTSAGYTQASNDVWGYEVPYLEGTESKWDMQSPEYINEITLSKEKFKKIIQENFTSLTLLDGELLNQIQILVRNKTGYVSQIQICNQIITGEEFRKILNLKSSDFILEEKGKDIVITTKGYGHGVGMSQYGANGMATEGYGYKDILNHYYKGINLEKIHLNE